MLIILLVIAVLSLLVNIVVLSGFWDMYKRVRNIEQGVNSLKSAEASEHLQKIAKMKD